MYPVIQQMPVINMKRTGERLKKLAEESGLSARALSDLMGFTSDVAIYKWYRGETLPSRDNLLILQRIFGLDSINQMLVVDIIEMR